MNEQIMDIRDITHSREMYEAKPRPLVSAFIYIVLVVVVGALIWTYWAEIDIVAKGRGVVRPNQRVSTLAAAATGYVESVEVTEGQAVTKGEVLYVLNHDRLLIGRNKTQQDLKNVKERLKALYAYEESLRSGESAFTPGTFTDYYETRYENYQANMAYLGYQKESTRLKLEQSNQTDLIRAKLQQVKDERWLMGGLKKSIEQGENLTGSEGYGQQFEDYNSTYKNYVASLNKLKVELEKSGELLEAGIIPPAEYEAKQFSLDNEQRAFEQFQARSLAEIEAKIRQAKESIKQLEAQLEGAKAVEGLLDNEAVSGDAAMEKYKMDTLVSVMDDIQAYEKEGEKLAASLESMAVEIANSHVKATADGLISITREVAGGDYLTAGTALATIIPGDETSYTVDIALPNSEVASIQPGDEIKFQFEALPFKEYGEFSGRVTSISSDVKTDGGQGSYYLVEASLEETEGMSYKGEVREIKVGMTSQAYIVTEQKKILYWLLEKVNLKD